MADMSVEEIYASLASHRRGRVSKATRIRQAEYLLSLLGRGAFPPDLPDRSPLLTGQPTPGPDSTRSGTPNNESVRSAPEGER